METVAADIMALVEPADDNVVTLPTAGRGAGYQRLRASAGFSSTVDRTLEEQRAALTPRPRKDEEHA